MENKKYLKYFFITMILFSILYFFICYKESYYIDSVFFGDHNDTFADFFNCVYGGKGNSYIEGGGNYPALALLFFKICYKFVQHEGEIENGLAYRNMSIAWIELIIFFLFCIWLTCISISNMINIEIQFKRLFFFVLLFSTPVLFSIERGNIILLSFALTIFYISFRNDKNNILKEISFVFLAIAAAIKIYPAIFGLLLIKEKKHKEALRLTFYGILFFFIPFLYFGKNSLYIFFECLKEFANIQSENFAYNFSIFSNLKLFFILNKINITYNLLFLVTTLLIGFIIISFWKTKNKWEEYLALTIIMLWIPKVSYAYVMLFMIIPFSEFINNIYNTDYFSTLSNRIIERNIPGLLFFILFTPWALPIIPEFSTFNYKLTYTYIVYYIVTFALGMFLLFNNIILRKSIHSKEKKNDYT